MTFFKRAPKANEIAGGIPKKKKIGSKIFFGIITSLFILTASYVAYLVASGSKAFENGINGTSIVRSLYGKQSLKGEERGRVNILLMGMGGANHPGGMLADSLMLVSIRTSDKKIAIMSFPRDLYVKIPNHGEDKINAAFADGYNDYMQKNCTKKNSASTCYDAAVVSGANLTSQTVAEIANIPIDYYVSVDFKGFEKLIDQLGGIDINVDKTINDPFFPDERMIGYQPFKITAGQHHLDGSTALKYARSRHTTSDFDRAARQQKIIESIKDTAMSSKVLSNPKKIADLVSTLGNSIKTNLSISELKTLADMVSGVSKDQIVSKVLTSGPNGLLVDYNDGIYYLKPRTGNFKEIQSLAKNIFDQYVDEKAKIEVQNGSKTSGLGSKLAQSLQDDGYEIAGISTAKEKTASTVIYDLSGGEKKNTIAFLKTKLNAPVISKAKTKNDIGDITIIIGDDYQPSK